MRPGQRAVAGPRETAGVTLIEVLVALLFLMAVAAIGMPVYRGAIQRARETAVVAYLRQWPPAQEAFFAARDRYAASLDELVEAELLGRMHATRIGYDFTITVTVASGARGGGERVARVPAGPSWWSGVGFGGTAWANGGGRSGRNGGGDPDRDGGEPAPAPSPGSPSWEGWANPRNGRGRYFYLDRTKVIRYAEGGPAGRSSAEIPER